MNTFEAIEARRSVKHFDSEHEMPDNIRHQLLESALLSPTAFNIQHWRFVDVQDRELRQKIKTLSWNQAQVADASMLLILCADLKAWKKEPERYWRNAPTTVKDTLVPVIKNYYYEDAQSERDECMRSCGMAAQTIMLAAKALGYESCPMDGFDFAEVGKLINLPEDHLISMFICIGKPLKEANPRGGQLPLDEVLFQDHF